MTVVVRRLADVVTPPLLFAGALLALWWIATVWFEVQPLVLPSPPQVATVFGEQGGYLWRGTRTTLTEAVAGYVIAAGMGLGLGTLLASWPALKRAALPTLVALDAVPKIALAPVLMVAFGLGMVPKIGVVVATCLLPVVLATMHGLTNTPTDHVELARSLSASWWQQLVKIRFPFALPRIFVGLRIAAPLAVIGAVVAELFGAVSGLGYAIRAAGSQMALVWAVLMVLAGMSLALYAAVAVVERLAVPWAAQVNA